MTTSDIVNLCTSPIKPKRALNAYNFFQIQRQQILDVTPTRAEGKPRRSHGKIGFKDLTNEISRRWRAINADDKTYYYHLAKEDRKRFE